MKRTSIVSSVGILLVLAVLVVVNLIANTRFVRIDLTSGKIFTLSKASRHVVTNLGDKMTVKVFASRNMSPQLTDVRRYLNDMLSDYQTYSKGKFHYEFVDPGSDEDLEKEAQSYRIPPFQENVWQKDKLELAKVYMGMVFLYSGKQETIPTVQSTSGLEYDITSLIKRMSAQQDRTVGFLQGHGEPSPFEKMKNANQVLQANYKVTTVDLSKDKEVAANIDALIVVQPESEIPDDQKLKIDQYIMNGKGVGWLMGKVDADLQQGMARARQLKLDPWLGTYGIRINEDIVADSRCAMINIQQRVGFFTMQNQVNYPFFPVINTFNKKSPLTGSLEMASLFFPSSVDTSSENASIHITPAIYSSDKSFVESGTFNIAATRKFTRGQFDRAHLPLGVTLQGAFPSYFAGKELPKTETGEPIVDAAAFKSIAPDSTRMVVIGDGSFVTDDYLTSAANLYLLLNTVDWLVNDTELIGLRTREIVMRPLKELTPAQKDIWKYFNWFLPPVLVVLLGLVYWQIRRATRIREI